MKLLEENNILNVKKTKKYEVARRKQYTKRQKSEKSMKLLEENNILNGKKSKKV